MTVDNEDNPDNENKPDNETIENQNEDNNESIENLDDAINDIDDIDDITVNHSDDTDEFIESSDIELEDDGLPDLKKRSKSNSLSGKLILVIGAVITIILIVLFSQEDSEEPQPIDGSNKTKSFKITNNLGNAPKIPKHITKPDLHVHKQPTTKDLKQISPKEFNKISSIVPVPPEKNTSTMDILEREKEKLARMGIRSRKNNKGIVYFNNSNTSSATTNDVTASDANMKSQATADGDSPTNTSKPIGQALSASVTPSMKANILADRDMFITKGAFLDCVLETALDSTLSGMTSCRLTSNVYSTSGKVLLLERGSKVIGEYMGGIKNGQARIFAVWSRIETPSGVLIDISSPGTGPLGQAGHQGHIETFFWKRFGSAILLSFIDNASKALASRLRKTMSEDEANVISGDSSSGQSEIALKALEEMMETPPILTKNQGDHINIFVARDLDFRTVYELRTYQ